MAATGVAAWAVVMLVAAMERRILKTWKGYRGGMPPLAEEVAMFELGLLMLAVCGAVWLCGALFKLTLGLIGVIFGGLFGLVAASIVALVVLPIVFLAMLPVLVPVLCTALLVWFIVRASRPRHPAPSAH